MFILEKHSVIQGWNFYRLKPDVLKAVNIKITISCNTMPCSMVDTYILKFFGMAA